MEGGKLVGISFSLARLALNCCMYIVAKRSVSSFDSFVSAGTHGNLVFNRENALDRTRIRALSLAFAAFLSTGIFRRFRDPVEFRATSDNYLNLIEYNK